MAFRPKIVVDDDAYEAIREFRLRARDLREPRREVAEYVVNGMRQSPMTRQQRRVIDGVRAAASGAIAFSQTRRNPFIFGAFFGAKRWRQFQPWVGNDWDLIKGSGPYVLAPFVYRNAERISDMFSDGIMDAARRAQLRAEAA